MSDEVPHDTPFLDDFENRAVKDVGLLRKSDRKVPVWAADVCYVARHWTKLDPLLPRSSRSVLAETLRRILANPEHIDAIRALTEGRHAIVWRDMGPLVAYLAESGLVPERA